MNEVRGRSGRTARQAERAKKGGGIGRPYIVRNIPTYDVLSEENLLRIEAAADRVLAETGIEFRDDRPCRGLAQRCFQALRNGRVKPAPLGTFEEQLRHR